MPIPRWNPDVEPSSMEVLLLRRLRRTRKLFGFLREQRHVIFDESFQMELASMYRDTGAGKDPLPPALLAMATLLQGHLGVSDAEAVELSVVDLRWRMALGVVGATTPAFSQGALHDFRHRLTVHDMDRRLLTKTAEVARQTQGFDAKKLRVAADSAPLEGAGRVEDAINLVAHAAREVIECVAVVMEREVDGRERLRRRAPVEHSLERLAYRQGRRARYVGRRGNLFDLRRACATHNLEAAHRAAA